MIPLSYQENRTFILDILKRGQLVLVKEAGGRFEITQMDDLKVGHKVLEIGNDFVLVEDFSALTETRIPVTSIKSLVKLKLPRE
jgi:hypothetical protein